MGRGEDEEEAGMSGMQIGAGTSRTRVLASLASAFAPAIRSASFKH